MKVVNRKTVQTAPSPAYQRHFLVVVAALLGGCGAHALHAASDGPAAAGFIGEGGNTDVGGAMASGGNGGGVASGGRTAEGGGMTGGGGAVFVTVSTGGVRSLGGGPSSGQDGGDSPDGFCEDTPLIFEAIRIYLDGTGSCMPTPDGKTSWGNIVFDSEGRVIDITRSGVSQTEPVDALAGLSWPCFAGLTIPYFCQTGE